MQPKNSSRSLARSAILGAAAVCLVASDAHAQDLTLVGTARDFRADHPDFAIAPADGPGHYPANASLVLDGRDRPEFAGPGFKVAAQWRNMNADEIAPHMYMASDATVVVQTAPNITANALVDSYDAAAGPYDPSTAGAAPAFAISGTQPVIPAGPPKPPYSGDMYLSDNTAIAILDQDYYVGMFVMSGQQQVRVQGNVTLWVDDWFYAQDNGTAIDIPDGSSLTIYVGTKFRMINQTMVGATDAPGRVTIYNMGTNPIDVLNQAQLAAHVVSPNAGMFMLNGSGFFGTLEAETLSIDGNAEFHNDGLGSANICGNGVADSEGLAGVTSPADIDSDQSFSQWFRDIDGVNASKRHHITLTSDGNGFYEFSSDNFLPLEDELYGYDNGSTNSYFTFQINAEFTYNGCTDQQIELQGSDDIWVYVDGKLLIDLGGMGANQAQVGELDRLGLTDGQRYTMCVFYAHRSGSTPRFRIRTNVGLFASLATAQAPVYAGWD